MTSSDHCKFEDKIMEMFADIKGIKTDIEWLLKDNKMRNRIMEKHVMEGEQYRDQITRNTVWRHVYKVAVTILFSLGGYIIGMLIQLNKGGQ